LTSRVDRASRVRAAASRGRSVAIAVATSVITVAAASAERPVVVRKIASLYPLLLVESKRQREAGPRAEVAQAHLKPTRGVGGVESQDAPQLQLSAVGEVVLAEMPQQSQPIVRVKREDSQRTLLVSGKARVICTHSQMRMAVTAQWRSRECG
jgi:hypothetical protein